MKNFEPNRAFNTEVAAALGIYQAILIQQIRYWQEKSTHEIDGRKVQELAFHTRSGRLRWYHLERASTER